MPLLQEGAGSDCLGDGLVQDIITRLARLRSVHVVARGSVFALAERGMQAAEAASVLASITLHRLHFPPRTDDRGDH